MLEQEGEMAGSTDYGRPSVLGSGFCYLCGEGTSKSWQKCSSRDETCQIEACSLECLKIHFNEEGSDAAGSGGEDNKCNAFKMNQNDEVGRFLQATRQIRPQEIVLKDPPLIIAPQSLPVCLICLKPLTESNLEAPPIGSYCQLCSYPMCSAECASEHRSCQYQEECELLAKIAISPTEDVKLNHPSLLYSMIGVLRLLLAQDKLPKPFDKNWIAHMMDHREDLFDDKVMTNHINSMSKVLLEDMELRSRFNENDVIHAFGVLRINSFGIDTKMGGRGRGLFPLLALMSHSCQSNLQHEPSKSMSAMPMVLTAQRTIEEGEELTIRYIDTIQVGYLERQKLLEDQWYFKCGCTRCKDPSDCGTWSNSISCFQCANPRLSPANDTVKWACKNCQAEIVQYNLVEDVIHSSYKQWNNSIENSLKNGDLTPSFNLLGDMKHGQLSRFHNMVIKMSLQLAKSYFQLGPKSRKEDHFHCKLLCEEILQFLTMIDPGTTKVMATFLLQYNKTKVNLDKINFEEGNLTRADYLQSIKEAVIVQSRAQKVLLQEV